MENKINIAELLRNCPSGMKLDCTMYEDVYFDLVNNYYNDTINCYTLIDGIRTSITFTKYGTFNNHTGAKCVVFPKGKTTWEGFVPPCKFKDGDVLCNSRTKQPFILKFFDLLNNNIHSYCGINDNNKFHTSSNNWTFSSNVRLATEEEKEKLFNAIKDNGYKWNAETKTLEKVFELKFKVGDRGLFKKHNLKII